MICTAQLQQVQAQDNVHNLSIKVIRALVSEFFCFVVFTADHNALSKHVQ